MHDIWALYLIFRNKKEITQHLLNLRSIRWPFSACLSAPLRWCALAGKRLFYRAVFLFVVRSGNSLKFMMGATVRSLAIIGIAHLFPVCFPAGWRKPSPSRHNSAKLSGAAKTAEWLAFGGAKTARILTVCVAVMLLLSAWGYSISGTGCKTVRGRKP